MSAASSARRPRAGARRQILLASASLISLLASAPAYAGDILRSNVTAAPITASAASQAAAQQAALASQRAQETLTRTTQALQAMQAAQSAAHAMALAMPSNIPNGLGVGGLQVVANPVVAAQDTTGFSTWQGADGPAQTNDANGHASVTIKQTDSRAILSWQSYNVGKDTTLTYDQQGNKDWVALNRVVGADASPSQILGSIKADGTVLILNQNGILFGGSSQINVNSLVATTLEVGRSNDANAIRTIAQRNQEFLSSGLLGYADSNNSSVEPVSTNTPTFSPVAISQIGSNRYSYASIDGAVRVENGASVTSGEGGYILLAGPTVENAGHLTANDGQVILVGADTVALGRATGSSDSVAPELRGFVALAANVLNGETESAVNDTTGLIESPRGSIIIAGANTNSGVVNLGGLFATTSVSRNGAIELSGPNVEVAPDSIIAITADDNGETIPQDPSSLTNFKSSVVAIGNLNNLFSADPDHAALIDIGAGSLIYAPSGNITVGATSGSAASRGTSATSRIFIDVGAVIDASGLKDVPVPASRNQIEISPLKNNELADSPQYKDSFLNGATVYVDPRLSGVRDDGVAWIGSPLIDAASYYQQVGVTAPELMTRGGNVTLGVDSFAGSAPATDAPNVIVKAGAVIDISGGWVTYQAGKVQTTQLVTSDGRVVDIGNASLDDTYVGIYNGYVASHSRWGITETYANPFGSNVHYSDSYTEGRDAGSLTLKASAVSLDGTVYAEAFPGVRQTMDAKPGTGTSSVFGDERQLQAAPSQLPAGGFLFIQAQTELANSPGVYNGGADVRIVSGADYRTLGDDVAYGQTISATPGMGVTLPTRDGASFLSADQLGTIRLSDDLLSDPGFSQISLGTSGAVTVASDADITLASGGIFGILAGRKITVDGVVTAPSGQISLATFDSRSISAGGSVFATTAPEVGDYDIVVTGTLSAGGRWVNDFGLSSSDMEGGAWLNGGAISLYAAPQISTIISVASGATPATSTDLSGSILINRGSTIDVSGGGRVDRLGNIDFSARGGDLSLFDETSYFQYRQPDDTSYLVGGLSGFRVNGLLALGDSGSSPYVPVNPDQINAHIAIDPDAIRAQGFAGGGTFTMTAPEFAFGNNDGLASTELPLDFISGAGFSGYNITSYKSDIIANPFNNGLGGTDVVLATQTLTVGAGQTLNLSQSLLPNVLSATQLAALRDLASGGDIFSVLSPMLPANAWDRRAVNLTLGGLLELDVAQGGSITGEAGASLTVSKLLNEGNIRLPGGTILQRQVMPQFYTKEGTLGVYSLSDAFSVNSDGSIDENAPSHVAGLTNAQLAGAGVANIPQPDPIYLLGSLGADQGIVLAPGSVTDLSGISIHNPYATDGVNGKLISTGRIIGGGTITTEPDAALPGQSLYQQRLLTAYQILPELSSGGANGIISTPLDVVQTGLSLTAEPGAILNLSGASDVYDVPAASMGSALVKQGYAPTPVWSDAGTLVAQAGATLTGASIQAHGGAAQAENGTLVLLDPVLTQHEPDAPTANIISADMIVSAGFDTFVALGSVSARDDVVVDFGRAFFLQDRPVINNGSTLDPNTLVPTIRSGGGSLTINAPYISFESNFDAITTAAAGAAGNGSVAFNATDIDFTGALLIDRSVSEISFNALGDIRLTGVVPWQQTFYLGVTPVASLHGQIAVNGDLTFNVGQIYPTTGSSFDITSANPTGTITFGRSNSADPAAPYSAGGNLLVQAANIVQGGVIRVPLGTLTLGSADASVFAPETRSVVLTAGSTTSVSANGLVIPYGTTTDQSEWYFAPTNVDPLSAPPQKLLTLNGTNLAIDAGATVDISGGGDVYAYEFVPGTGGSRDVLDKLNPDTFTSNNGYQYPDGRQVYAIVPGLSNAPVATYDPIYSTGYDLASSAGVGNRVYLDGGNGFAAGWYTLLPAKYALLPGGMRVVEQTEATNVTAGTSLRQPNGGLIVSGHFGDALSGASGSQERLFSVQAQAVFSAESNDVETTGNTYFADLATHDGTLAAQLPVDAGRIVLNPGATLTVDAVVSTTPGQGGRGAQVDLGGTMINILASLPESVPNDGTIRVTATSLSNLNADSLLIGGTRTDNADGSTSLDVTASDILVQNDSSTALSAGEIVIAANDGITVANGALISGNGTLSDTRAGAYNIGSDSTSGTGVLLRIANGPERLVDRVNSTAIAHLTVGAATLSGTSIGFDSSGMDVLDPNLVLRNADYVSIGAPRIGFGADPATYDGLIISGALEGLLTQSGAHLTLRSQSSIDFAAGVYEFGDIRFDTSALSGLNGGDVAIHGGEISLGNVGAAGTVCTTCVAGSGQLAIDAASIVFTGGGIATKASTLTASVTANTASDVVVTLPAGTRLSAGVLAAPTQMVVPAGTAITLASGTGVLLPAAADGALVTGTTITPISQRPTVSGSFFFPNPFFIVGNGAANTSAGTYSLSAASQVSLPAGTQAVLTVPGNVALSQFFGGGVTLSAASGVFAQGSGSVLDVGPADLSLHTPYIGDRAIPLQVGNIAVLPDLILATTGALTIDNAGAGIIPAINGIPGASITINGQSISVSGTAIHATAGSVTINSVSGLTLADNAVVEAPGYTAVFGDSVDPTTQNAPGGHVTLAVQDGDIALGDAVISVGGGSGDAGTLTLSATNGLVDFGTAKLNGRGGEGGAGGNFVLDSRGGVDLAAFNDRVGTEGFTGGFTIHTGVGDLLLSEGAVLKGTSVSLTADGGTIDIAGGIDTSGVNGGDVSLYGRNGVVLERTAHIDATATGYAGDDTRQAKGGNVTLGTDFISYAINGDGSVVGSSGVISIASGAIIDVSARRPGDRLVPYYANGVEYYRYAQGDQGGIVTLRVPVEGGTVNVSVASASGIVGADAINLVGFKRWDLGAVADSGLYSGVTRSGSTVTLNVGADLDTPNSDGTLTTVGGVNFLGDKGTGTLVDFVQNYDTSSSYGQLGGLALQANFHAQPGLDLTYGGNVTLASNWNLGAGVVNQDAAIAGVIAGAAMQIDPALNVPVVVPGQEANLLANYTSLTYRVGGLVTGEPGQLSLRSGGTLDIKGSITDGFFQFRDQTDPVYLSSVGVNNSGAVLVFNTGQSNCATVAAAGCSLPGNLVQWNASTFGAAGTTNPAAYFAVGMNNATRAFLTGGSAPIVQNAPFSAIANSPAALGSFTTSNGNGNVNGGGDPLGSAVIFPLLPQSDGSARPVLSWSYNLIAGADLAEGMGILPSVNPSRINPIKLASLIVEGTGSYTYAQNSSASVLSGIGFDISRQWSAATAPTAPFLSTDEWLDQFSTNFDGVDDNATALLYWGTAGNNTLYNLLYAGPGGATNLTAPGPGSLLRQFIDNNHLVLGSGGTSTANPPGETIGDYRLSTLTAATPKNGILMTVGLLKEFFQQEIIPNVADILNAYRTQFSGGTGSPGATVTAYSKTMVRTGTGDINVAASGNVDTTNGAKTVRRIYSGGALFGTAANNSYQVGGTSIYTVGHPVSVTNVVVDDPNTGAEITFSTASASPISSNFNSGVAYTYGAGTGSTSQPGILIADPVYAEGGGDVSVSAGSDVLGRRDSWLAANANINASGSPFVWVGAGDEPWRTGAVGNDTTAAINPQLFPEGVGALGGGNISVSAGRNVSDISVIATDSMITANATGTATPAKVLATFGNGNVSITAGLDILGGRVDVASGQGIISAGGDIINAPATQISIVGVTGTTLLADNLLRVRLFDAVIDVEAAGDIAIQGGASLGVLQNGTTAAAVTERNNALGLYSNYAALNLVSNGSISVPNGNDNLWTPMSATTGTNNTRNAVYPGTFTATSVTGNLDLLTNSSGAASLLLAPSPIGQLRLLAGGDIGPTSIAMLDADPGILPGPFSTFQATNSGQVVTGVSWVFPAVFPSTLDSDLVLQHNQIPTHINDSAPVWIAAGGDIGNEDGGIILSVPKQTRIAAGRDIVNMMFFGQNLASSDITRVVAGRDITATSALTGPVSVSGTTRITSTPMAALQGNTFILGGPGALILEAGRDIGPFLNSADVTSWRLNPLSNRFEAKDEIYGGGILSIGNDWNPWLPDQGADVSVLFGVAGGVNYDGFRESYLDPANLASMPDYLFEQDTTSLVSGGVTSAIAEANRSKPIYGPMLVSWMQANASAALKAAYGSTNVDYERAYSVFVELPKISQQAFLDKVYFNELKSTADPDGPSYLKYSRGYEAVNTLFPASDGYTQNDLTGGSNGANATVETGNLDLRLATIQTAWGGDITIMGPGGRVIAGSTVRTTEQAARRTYDGGRLFAGKDDQSNVSSPLPSAIDAIPSGYEGVLTLRGGDISTFTDGDFLLNQSRLFTEQGGEITMWSSNADLNAGQGPKTSANFPPVILKVNQDLYSSADQAGATTGAGIAALQAVPDAPASEVYLIAPRGTVDFGDAGVRVSGDLFVAALNVANADNAQVGGRTFGVPVPPSVDTGALSAASNTAAAAAQNAMMPLAQGANTDLPSIITVQVMGYGGDGNESDQDVRRHRSQ